MPLQFEIDDKTYDIAFGIGFLEELNRTHQIQKEGLSFGIGLDATIGLILNSDTTMLATYLYCGGAGQSPRISKENCNRIIEKAPSIEDLFEQVVDQLKKSNATTVKVTKSIKDYDKEQRRNALQERIEMMQLEAQEQAVIEKAKQGTVESPSTT